MSLALASVAHLPTIVFPSTPHLLNTYCVNKKAKLGTTKAINTSATANLFP